MTESDFSKSTFTVIEFTPQELLTFDPAELKFLSTVCLILNDIKFLVSATLGSNVDGSTDEIRRMQLLRTIWYCRKLAAVLYEAQIALRRDGKHIPFVASQFMSGGQFPFSEPHSKRNLAILKLIRNEHTNHYDLKLPIDSVSQLTAGPVCFGFAHQQNFNSVYGLAEEFLISGIFRDHSIDDIWSYFQWCLRCVGEISVFCESNAALLISKRFPQKVFSEIKLEMGNETGARSSRLPLHRQPPETT